MSFAVNSCIPLWHVLFPAADLIKFRQFVSLKYGSESGTYIGKQSELKRWKKECIQRHAYSSEQCNCNCSKSQLTKNALFSEINSLPCIHLYHQNWFFQRIIVFLSSVVYPWLFMSYSARKTEALTLPEHLVMLPLFQWSPRCSFAFVTLYVWLLYVLCCVCLFSMSGLCPVFIEVGLMSTKCLKMPRSWYFPVIHCIKFKY